VETSARFRRKTSLDQEPQVALMKNENARLR
jgi:hypothetical protein